MMREGGCCCGVLIERNGKVGSSHSKKEKARVKRPLSLRRGKEVGETRKGPKKITI